MNLILSSRIKLVASGARRFLTFWRSLEGFSVEQDVFMRTRFCQKLREKMQKMFDNVRQHNI